MQFNEGKKNLIYGLAFQLLTFSFGFVIRKLLVENCGLYLVGVNGIYENIISMLSLLNFGIGSACMYYLYKAFSYKKFDDVIAYYQTFVKLFRYVALGITIIGAVLLIKIDWIIDTSNNDVFYLRLFFFIHLIKCIFSFLITCPRYTLQCDEKRYYCLKADIIALIIFSLLRIIALVITKSYILYLFLSLLEVILSNTYIYICFKKQYSNINFKKDINVKNQISNVLNYAKHLAISNINYFINNCTDNIVISKILGTITVGLMSNYYLIVDAVKGFSTQIFSSLEATIVKRFNLANNKQEEINIYEDVMFISYAIALFVSVFLFVLTDSFISIYFGDKYSIGNTIPLLMVISLAISILQYPSTDLLTAKGLMNKTVFVSTLMMISNIGLSIILAKIIGVNGVLIGTIVANIILLVGHDYLAYKFTIGFNKRILCNRILHIVLIVISLFVSNMIIPEQCTFFEWILLGIKCFIIWIIFMLPFYKKLKPIINEIKK